MTERSTPTRAASSETTHHEVVKQALFTSHRHDLAATTFAGILVLFFLSGAASLVCEVLWFKQLQHVLGSSTRSASVVVSCFFGGLALGGWLGGRLADRSRRPLLLYGAMEASLGAVAVGVTLVLANWQSWATYVVPWLAHGPLASTLTMIGVGVAVLLPPTILMGATLPVLSRFVVRQEGQLSRRIGLLYALNTLGASLGCLVVGFVLIGWFGVLNSAFIAAGTYLTVATVAVLLGWRNVYHAPSRHEVRFQPTTVDHPLPDTTTDTDGHSTPPLRTSPRLLMAAFAVSGFASVAYEVVWFRLISCFSVPSVYCFSAMLATYLVGLVLGALIASVLLARRRHRHLVYFARVQLLTAVAALVSLAVLGRSRNITHWLADFEGTLGLSQSASALLSGAMPIVGLSLAVLLVPTVIIGIGFPIAVDLVTNQLGRVGSRVGGLYFLNTAGGVLGSLAAGFLLIPWLGSQNSLISVAVLNVAIFAALMVGDRVLRRDGSLWREGGVATAGMAAIALYLGPTYIRDAQTVYADAHVLAFRENADANFTVLGYDEPHTGPYQQIVVNGTSYANNSPPGRRYMAMLGHLPALVHPDPKSAVVIAIGTGTTVGSLTLHEGIERIAAVDIAQEVFDVAPLFAPLNANFTACPRVEQVVADGRHFLLCEDRKFDVLTFEPPPPNEAGVVNLYSREFYQLAKQRLAPGGIICQWVPLNMPREALCRIMLKTILEEFPYVTLWIPSRYEGIVLASNEPMHIDVDRIRERMSAPRLHDDMAAYGLDSVERLLSTFVADRDSLVEMAGDADVATDNHPRIEHFNRYPHARMRYDEILAHRDPVELYTRGHLDGSALDAARTVTDHVWYSHEAEDLGHRRDALRHIEQALQVDPANEYLRYRRAQIESHDS
ncbi:MAG: fused MFS/spermidine synthase [Pirellulales bacterium]